MKFKIIILLFLSSCVNYSTNNHKKQSNGEFEVYLGHRPNKNISNFFSTNIEIELLIFKSNAEK